MAQLNVSFLIIFVALSVYVTGERILFLLPLASKSHVHVFEPLIRALGERGHEVVSLSPLKSPNMPSSVKQIQLVTVDDLLGKLPNHFEMRQRGRFAQLFNLSVTDQLHRVCNQAAKHPLLAELLEKDSFDLVIANIFTNFCLLGVIPHFKAPSIFVTTMSAPSSVSNFVGNRLPPSFVPNSFSYYSDKMTFFERMVNSVFDVLLYPVWQFYLYKSEQVYKEHLPNGQNLPSLNEICGNTSMIFMNSHFTLNYPRPLLPDVIEVGGMHARPANKSALGKDLNEFLNGSGKEGFIFFSLGSILKGKDMPESSRKVFVKVFSKLKQRVLWKWETETMPDLPPNVMLGKWLPQQEILGHPNIRIFITHGGLLSTQEAVYHGVPVIGIPIFADQDLNVQQAELHGYAKTVEIVNISEEKLETAILELLNNPKYFQRAKELSKQVRDLPQTPLEKAVFWTEYVLRHKGAHHLQSASRQLNFFQYYILDVALVSLLIVTTVLYLILCCCKATCKRICGRRSIDSSHAKKE